MYCLGTIHFGHILIVQMNIFNHVNGILCFMVLPLHKNLINSSILKSMYLNYAMAHPTFDGFLNARHVWNEYSGHLPALKYV